MGTETAVNKTRKQPAKATQLAYKGFSKDLKCRDHQYEIGKTYIHDGPVGVCASGFHSCLRPLDVLSHYPAVDGNRFAVVRIDGTITGDEGDTKCASKSIFIEREVTISELILFEIDYISKKAKGAGASSGDYSTAASSGDYSKAASSGDYSKAASSGYNSKAASSGYNSKAASSGDNSTAASSGYKSTAACDTNGFACVAGVGGHVRANIGSAIALGYADTNGVNRFAAGVVGENGIEEGQWYSCDQSGFFIKI